MRKPTRHQIVRELRHREKHAFDEMAGFAADLIEKQSATKPSRAEVERIITLLESSAQAWEDMAGNSLYDAEASSRMQARARESRGNVERIRAMFAAADEGENQ